MDTEKSPQQDRRRATAQRLLSATIRVISESGLDAATVPKIAALAEVAPASVYRRYHDRMLSSALHSCMSWSKATLTIASTLNLPC